MKIGVLVSDEGPKLEAMHRAGIEPVLVLADRPCTALSRGQAHRLRLELLTQRDDLVPGFDKRREAYTKRVIDTLTAYEVDVVVDDGFKTTLSPAFVERYPDHAVNAECTVENFIERLKQAAHTPCPAH